MPNYEKLRNLACHVWGVGPWEFERAARAGELALEDVLEAVALESLHMEIDVGKYFRLEMERTLKRRHGEVVGLLRKLKGMPEGEEKEALRRRIKELNRPVKG